MVWIKLKASGFPGYGLEGLQLKEIEDALAGELDEDVPAGHSAAGNLEPHQIRGLSLGMTKSFYFGPKVVPFWVHWGQVYPIWVHGPLGLGFKVGQGRGELVCLNTEALIMSKLNTTI